MSRRFEVGQICREKVVIDSDAIERFAAYSGDRNPIHVSAEAARLLGFSRPVAHGAILFAALSRLIGTHLPGPGALWMRQAVEWKAPVLENDEIELALTVTAYSEAVSVLEFEVGATNQRGETVMSGSGAVKVPEQPESKIERVQTPKQRVALITGGSRGIGAAIALHLAGLGWAVAINYLTAVETADALASRIRKAGGIADTFRADLSDPDAGRRLIGQTIRTFGRVDAVVHCATPPISRTGVDELAYADVEPFLRTYLGGALGLISAARPTMQEQHFGRIVMLGTAALFGSPPTGWGAYVAAKASLVGLVNSAAAELGPLGITVNMVSPSLTVTDLTADVSVRAKELEARRAPARRLATAEDTAALVGFLLGENSGYISGAHIPVTSGPI